jgi:PAS domain S-box-containing protein
MPSDATDTRIGQQVQSANEKKFRVLLDALYDLVWSVDLDGRITFVNRASERVYGLKPQQMIGRPESDFVPEHQTHKHQLLLKQPPAAGESLQRYENEVGRTDGTLRLLTTHATYLRDDVGHVVGVCGISQDMTEVKQARMKRRTVRRALRGLELKERETADAERERLRNELIHTTRLATLGKMSAQIAHDLRNPLGAVRNAAYYLKKTLKDDNAEVTDFVGVIEDEVRTCDAIIQNLLEITRPRQADRQWNDLAEQTRAAFVRLSAPRGIELKFHAPSEPFLIYFDAVQLRQLLDNLLINALEAVAEGGLIEVRAERLAHADRIQIHDSGPGIAPGIRDNIFELLFTTKTKGTGLGLAICRQLVQGHGGTIVLENHGQAGATFTVTVPRREATNAQEQECPQSAGGG